MTETPVGERLAGIEYGIKDLSLRQEEMKADNAAKHQELKTEITDIKKSFVSKIEFTPVKLITYGIVSIVLSLAFAAILNSVFHVIK